MFIKNNFYVLFWFLEIEKQILQEKKLLQYLLYIVRYAMIRNIIMIYT